MIALFMRKRSSSNQIINEVIAESAGMGGSIDPILDRLIEKELNYGKGH
jgi:predicted transcriptional regulator